MQRATLSHSRQHHGSTQGIGYVRPRRVVSRVPSPTPESPLPTTNPISSVPSYMSAVRTCECSEQRCRTCDCSELLLLLLLLLQQSRVTCDSCACVMVPFDIFSYCFCVWYSRHCVVLLRLPHSQPCIRNPHSNAALATMHSQPSRIRMPHSQPCIRNLPAFARSRGGTNALPAAFASVFGYANALYVAITCALGCQLCALWCLR